LKVSELPGATSLLANIEWITSIETDHDYVYVGAEEEKYADINDLLVKGGIRVFEMKKAAESLEAFFLGAINNDQAGDSNV